MGSVTVELSGVTDTEAIVTGLTPGARYIFSVTAENAVSSLENSGMNVITSTPMNTEEGGIYLTCCARALIYIDSHISYICSPTVISTYGCVNRPHFLVISVCIYSSL